MAVPDQQLRYATDVFDADGVTTDWQISFTGGYIDPSHVYAMSGITDETTGQLTDRTSHTVEVLSEDDDASTVRVSPAVAAGRKLYIYRSTPVQQMLVDYVNGSVISKTNLNLSNDQLLKIIQEMFDSLNIATLSIDQSLGVVVDLSKVVQEIYTQVLELLAAGGIVSVDPRTWSGEWSGETVGDYDFYIPGADVTRAGFYDVYVNGYGMEPDVDYEIDVDETDLSQSMIRFKTLPAEGSVWFAVLRGYAKPYTGTQPITKLDLRVPVIEAEGPAFYLDRTSEYAVVRCTHAAGCAVTVNLIPAVGDAETKLGTGSYISVSQAGGVVNIYGDPGVTLLVPAGCIARPRGVNSTVTLTCLDGDTNTWLLSGDLAME